MGIAALHEFNQENNKAGMGIAFAHIGNELDLLWCVLIGVVMRFLGEVPQGLEGTVVMPLPTVIGILNK